VKCNTKNQTAQAVSVQNLTKHQLASACGKMISKITPLAPISLDMVGGRGTGKVVLVAENPGMAHGQTILCNDIL
jgi:hypothetical protein